MIKIMGVLLPQYGDKVFCDNEEYRCEGVQVYFGKNNQIRSYRVHIGNGKYITKRLGGGYETNTETD